MKFKQYLIEVLYFLSIVYYSLYKLLEIKYINKSVGPYVYMLFCLIAVIFFKHVLSLPKSKHKNISYIVMPIIWVLTRYYFVTIGMIFLSINVLKWYERDRFTKVMKKVYLAILPFCLLLTAIMFIFVGSTQEMQDRYKDFVPSPNGQYIVSIEDRRNHGETPLYDYHLEKTYFGIYSKKDHVILNTRHVGLQTVEWVDDETVFIRDTNYNIHLETLFIDR